MRTLILILAVMLTVAHTAFSAPESDKRVAQMNNNFTVDLYAQLAARDGNLFFSPVSIQTALTMAQAGARGQTAEEMAKALRLEGDAKAHEQLGGFVDRLNAEGKTGGYELAMANALWGLKGYPFMPDYLNLVKKSYGGNLSELDFVGDPEASRKTINDWVAGQTHDRIKDLLPQGVIDKLTRLVLTNAVYFKGKWDQPFKKELTKEDDFTAADGKKIKASFMYQQARFRFTEDDEVQVLDLTYGKNELAMRVFLPKKMDGLAAFEKNLTVEQLAGLSGKLRWEKVQLWLPRFTMESQFSLVETLKAMGMKLAFDSDRADFKGMTTAEKVHISHVLHKAFVKVDEEGTEAAAATAVVVKAKNGSPSEPRVFKVDHPFVFQIVHQASGAVLFMGRLATP